MIIVVTPDGVEESFKSKDFTTWITGSGDLLIKKRIGDTNRLYKAFANGSWATVEDSDPTL